MNWRTSKQLNTIKVLLNNTLQETLPRMEEAALQILIIVNEEGLLQGIITDGDVRRAILKGLNLKSQLYNIMNKEPYKLNYNCDIRTAKTAMLKNNIRHIPLVDSEGFLKDLIIWSDCFGHKREKRQEKIVIMAGGKGTRLDPFTKILPKPMIPLGNKPIIEVIMDNLYQQGFENFIISLGYKAEIIKMYFNESNSRPYNIEYIQEFQEMGTAGALSLLKNKIKSTFIVINCDVILKPDFSELLKQHYDEGNHLTLIGSMKEITIPYGVLKTINQELLEIIEKPDYHFLVNTGVYVIEPQVLNYIKDCEFIHMTDLFQRIKNKGFKAGVYPHHGKWFDVGQWEDYQRTLSIFGSFEVGD